MEPPCSQTLLLTLLSPCPLSVHSRGVAQQDAPDHLMPLQHVHPRNIPSPSPLFRPPRLLLPSLCALDFPANAPRLPLFLLLPSTAPARRGRVRTLELFGQQFVAHDGSRRASLHCLPEGTCHDAVHHIPLALAWHIALPPGNAVWVLGRWRGGAGRGRGWRWCRAWCAARGSATEQQDDWQGTDECPEEAQGCGDGEGSATG